MSSKTLLTTSEAARYLRLDEIKTKHPEQTLYRYRKRGLLRAVRVGRKILYPVRELDRFVRLKVAQDHAG